MMNPPILYAEDDENDAFLADLAFKKAEILNRLVVVRDGRSAIEYLAGTGRFANRTEYPLPCLVLLDLKMPRVSGLEVLKWIRGQPRVCTMPVLMLTSSNQDSDVQRAYLLGANGYLIKPSRTDDMLAMAKGIRDFWLILNRNTGAVGSP
jgi:CheY-like chemotaxis protein